jgi:hypothetical protein
MKKISIDKPVNIDITPHANIQDGMMIEGLSSQCRNMFLKKSYVQLSCLSMKDETHPGTCMIMYPTYRMDKVVAYCCPCRCRSLSKPCNRALLKKS